MYLLHGLHRDKRLKLNDSNHRLVFIGFIAGDVLKCVCALRLCTYTWHCVSVMDCQSTRCGLKSAKYSCKLLIRQTASGQ